MSQRFSKRSFCRELAIRLTNHGYQVQDGNTAPHPLFCDGETYTVRPDMIIRRGDEIVALLDAKYKLEPKGGRQIPSVVIHGCHGCKL